MNFLNFPNQQKPFRVISFGEVMLRLSPTNQERISTGELMEKKAGGSELNVAAGISLLGLRTAIITKLPSNTIGDFVKNRIRFAAVSDDYIVYDKDEHQRLGIYYYENGKYPRKPTVVYDRYLSSMHSIKLEEIHSQVYDQATIFHVSGISLGLSDSVRGVAMEAVRRFKRSGALVSFDVNYRAALWSESKAREAVMEVLPYVDILFASEETMRKMLSMTGTVNEMMKQLACQHDVPVVATTMRKVQSPTRHSFSSIIYSKEQDAYYTEAAYENIEVVDRVGSGDAYVAGSLFGMLKYNDLQKAVQYGDAMAALKNTVPGDMPAGELEEIQRIIASHLDKGEQSEMNR